MKKIIIIISLFLSSCMVGPNPQRPHIYLPKEFENKTYNLKDKLSLDEWWKNFDDENLNKYINIAIINNFNLKIAVERIEEARSIYGIKKADLYPEINLNAQAIRQEISKNLTQTPFIGTDQNLFQFGFDAIWEIDFFGKLRRTKQAAFFSFLQQKDIALDVYITLLCDVIKTYIDIITYKNKIKLIEDKLFFQNQIYELIKDKFTSGLSNEIIEKEIFQNIQLIKQTITDLSTLYKTNIHRLAILLGRQPEDFEEEFKQIIILPIIKKDIEIGLPSDLLRRRPDIRSAEKFLYEKTANIGVAIADLFPSFSLVGSFDFESQKSKNWFRWASKSWSIGPTLNMPLLDFGRRLNNINAKKSEQKQAIYSYKNTVLLALEDVENALVAYFNEKDNLLFSQNKLNSQKIITTFTKDLFDSGLNSQITFLENQLILIDNENDYLDKKRNVSINLIALIKALGGGW